MLGSARFFVGRGLFRLLAFSAPPPHLWLPPCHTFMARE